MDCTCARVTYNGHGSYQMVSIILWALLDPNRQATVSTRPSSRFWHVKKLEKLADGHTVYHNWLVKGICFVLFLSVDPLSI